jgi:hypothetical protein
MARMSGTAPSLAEDSRSSATWFLATCNATRSRNLGGTNAPSTAVASVRTATRSPRYLSVPSAMSASAPRLNEALAVPAKTSSTTPFRAPTSVETFPDRAPRVER